MFFKLFVVFASFVVITAVICPPAPQNPILEYGNFGVLEKISKIQAAITDPSNCISFAYLGFVTCSKLLRNNTFGDEFCCATFKFNECLIKAVLDEDACNGDHYLTTHTKIIGLDMRSKAYVLNSCNKLTINQCKPEFNFNVWLLVFVALFCGTTIALAMVISWLSSKKNKSDAPPKYKSLHAHSLEMGRVNKENKNKNTTSS